MLFDEAPSQADDDFGGYPFDLDGGTLSAGPPPARNAAEHVGAAPERPLQVPGKRKAERGFRVAGGGGTQINLSPQEYRAREKSGVGRGCCFCLILLAVLALVLFVYLGSQSHLPGGLQGFYDSTISPLLGF